MKILRLTVLFVFTVLLSFGCKKETEKKLEKNSAQKPNIVAQGGPASVIGIDDSIINNSYGTSFSSPILAGGIACFKQVFPNLKNAELIDLVQKSASQYNNPDNFLGYGIPDLKFALDETLSLNTAQSKPIKIWPNPVLNEFHIKLPTQNVGLLLIKLDTNIAITYNFLMKRISMLMFYI